MFNLMKNMLVSKYLLTTLFYCAVSVLIKPLHCDSSMSQTTDALWSYMLVLVFYHRENSILYDFHGSND